MKKITFFILFLLSVISVSFGQVQIGTSNNIDTNAPFDPFYGYSYNQSIYLASEVNATGTITSIQWYYSGTTLLTFSQDIVIYMANTTKATFTGTNLATSDFVPLASLTQVYSGILPVGSTQGWITITLTTPFAYNGVDNLLVAVDENTSGWDLATDNFYNSPVATKRSATVYLDGSNINPATPTITATIPPNYSNLAFVPNIIFGGITQACPNLNATPLASSITTTAATITWTPPVIAPAGGYEFYVSTTATVPTVSETPTGVTAAGVLTTNLTSLLPATTYYVYVRAICSATATSGWSSPAVFASACVPVTSFAQSFDSGITLPNCWVKIGTSGNGTILSGNASSAPNSLNMSGSSATTRTLVAMPAISNAGAGTHWLKFKTRGYLSTTGVIEVGYLTNINDAASFISVQSIATPSQTIYQDNVVIFGTTPGSAQYLAFRHPGTAGAVGSVLIDDVVWETIPTCINPTLPIVTGITTTTADLSWTEPVIPAASYQYYVSTSNITPLSSATPTGIVTGINNTQLTGLIAATKYYVWVRSKCSATDISGWSSSAVFITECNPTALPWIENFDTLALGDSILPVCWSFFNTLKLWNIETVPVAYSGANSLGRTWSTNGWVFTPFVAMTAGTSYSFSYFVKTVNSIVGYEVTTAVGNAQTVAGMTNIISVVTGYNVMGWTKKTHVFVPTVSGNYSFGVKAFAPASGPAGINFDDMSITITPTCIEPTLVNATAITTTGATITWVEPITPAANGYQYYVSTSNVTPIATTTPTGNVVAALNNVALTGLTNDTSYFVWVRSVCNATNKSDWTPFSTFRTLCLGTNVPYIQDFETATVPALPACFTSVNAGTGNNWVTIASNAGVGFANKTIRYPFSSTSVANAWFFTQGINLVAGTSYDISYKFGNDSTIKVESLKIAYGQNPIVAAMTNPIFTHASVTGGAAQNNMVTFVPTTTGVYYFGFNAYSISNQNGLLVDDIKIVATPTCIVPTAVSVVTLTSTTANISWTAPAVVPTNGYDYIVSVSNTTPVATSIPTANVASSITSTTISGLTPGNVYYLWVRSVCSATDKSDWSLVKTFNTTVAPGCTTVIYPTDGDLNVPVGSIVLSWAAPTTGGTVVSYDIFSGLSPASATTLIVNTLSTTATVINTTFNTTVYWKVVAKNVGGSAVGCPIWGFKSIANPGYCLINQYASPYPTATYSPPTCDGVTVNTILTNGYASEYSNISVTAGQSYKFISSVATDFITIGNATGTTAQAYSSGGPIIWTATTAGVVRFYTHADGNCTPANVNRSRSIVCGASLSNSDFDNNAFSYYPNPVKDVLNVSYNATISRVSIYNLLGQEVLTKAINENLGQVDMSNLSAGTYLVKVVVDGNTKTIKVIKE